MILTGKVGFRVAKLCMNFCILYANLSRVIYKLQPMGEAENPAAASYLKHPPQPRPPEQWFPIIMDPLSIAASCAGVATICLRVSGVLYAFVDDAKNVDTNIRGFCDEILA